MPCLDNTLPIPRTSPPRFLLLCSWPMPTPTPSTGRCSNSFIVNLLLYGWFITKGFSLSCPLLMRRARRLFLQILLSYIFIRSQKTQGGTTLVHLSTTARHGWHYDFHGNSLTSVCTGGTRAVLMLIVN